jgi:hypothetical protein
MSNDLWRWADPDGQQRRVRLDELRAALASGLIAPNTPVWRSGWTSWQSAHDVPELTSSALSAANGLVPNIPPPPLAMVAMQREFESKGGGDFSPSAPPVESDVEPPPPPAYVPLPVVPPAAPSSGRLPRSGPSEGGPHIPAGLPTAIGLPPPPEMLARAAALNAGAAASAPPPVPRSPSEPAVDPMIEELSGSMLLDDSLPAPRPPTAMGSPVSDPFAVGSPVATSGPLPPPTDPVVRGGEVDDASLNDDELAGLPPRRRPQLTAIFDDLQEIKAGRSPKNKLLLGVLAILVFSVFISLLALVVSAIRGKPSELPSASASGSGSAPEVPAPSSTTTSAAAETATATAAAVVPAEEPKAAPPESGLGDCAMAGEAHVVSPRAYMPAGVEALAVPGAIALGFATDARNGTGVTVDPASIGITTTVKARALGGDARRMSPIFDKGKLTLVAGVDKKGDKLLGRRVVGTSPPIDVGVAEGSLAWAPQGRNSWAKLFPIGGDGPVDAIRAVPLGSTRGIAVALRRGNAVYVGVAKGEAVLEPEGSLARIEGLGQAGQVGSPSITTSGDTVIVAWSDRASSREPWQVRWTKLAIGGAPEEPKQLALPPGGYGTQAMSPSVAGIGGGRFVIAWSEGTPSHQVRAITLSADGTPSGSAMALSAAGVNAGQPQVAVGADGRGVIAFLAAKGKAYELHATPVACAAK